MEEVNEATESTGATEITESTSRIKDTILGIGGCLTYLIFAIGGLVLLIMFFKGTPWIAENIYPWVMMAAGVAVLIVVPISLLLAIFRRTRGIGGAGLFFSSYVVGLSLWVWSLIIAYSLAGVFWMIVGLFLGGVGIVPIALIACLIKAEWAIAVQISIIAVVVFALRGFGLFLAERTEYSAEQELINDGNQTRPTAIYAFASAWNNLDTSKLGPLLATNVVYTSQDVFEELQGKESVLNYLSAKMLTIKSNSSTHKVFAEIGELGTAPDPRSCVLLAQGNVNNISALVLLEIENNQINRIDICTVAPHPSSAKRTGYYPR